MTQAKLSHIFRKTPLIGRVKSSESDWTQTPPTISEDTSPPRGADRTDLANANALVVYLCGKTLTTLRPMTLVDIDTDVLTVVPAGAELKLLDLQPLHRRPAWRKLDLKDRVNMEYLGRPVLLTLKCFHDIFCLGVDDYSEDDAFD